MKKNVLLAFVLVVLSTAVVVRFVGPVVSYPAEAELAMEVTPVHNIDSGKNFSTIQEAINDNETQAGHTILVEAGIYYEHLSVNKSLNIQGVDRETTVIDGGGTGTVIFITASNVNISKFKVQKGYDGIYLENVVNCSLRNNNVSNNIFNGIIIHRGGHHMITDNILLNNTWESSVQLYDSWENTLTDNTLTGSLYGLWLSDYNYPYYAHNTVIRNKIFDNRYGLLLENCWGNIIKHNNFVNNTHQALVRWVFPETDQPRNIWDENYWSDYNGSDINGDGIGDIYYWIELQRNGQPYSGPSSNIDFSPLMGSISFFNAGTWNETTYYVHTVSNSAISDFYFSRDDRLVSFNVTGPDDSPGFCRVTIPNIIVQDLWQGNYTVLVDREEPIMMNNWTDGTYTYIYFTYLHSEHEVVIVPEFPTWTSTLLMLILLTVAIAIYKRRLLKTPIH